MLSREHLEAELAKIREDRARHEQTFNEARINVERHIGAEAMILQLLQGLGPASVGSVMPGGDEEPVPGPGPQPEEEPVPERIAH